MKVKIDCFVGTVKDFRKLLAYRKLVPKHILVETTKQRIKGKGVI